VLVEGGWDVNLAVDRHGLTPLQWAAGGGHVDVVSVFLYVASVYIIIYIYIYIYIYINIYIYIYIYIF